MMYTKDEVLQFVAEEDVKFIRLQFTDIFGKQKNISVMPDVLYRAFTKGISIDPSSIPGFGSHVHTNLLLHPDPDTFSILPWRPEHGRVVRMLCTLSYPDGTPFEHDTRSILKKAIADAQAEGYSFSFGSKLKFYLFKQDEEGQKTTTPIDHAGYMDIAPEDKGENIRRDICLTLERMGIQPTTSRHEKGPGQNEIDFMYSDALSAADNALTFKTVVRTVAGMNGVSADLSPKPIIDEPGNSFHMVINAESEDHPDPAPYILAGILNRIAEMTAFLNPAESSYNRLGKNRSRQFITWSRDNYSQLIRFREYEGKNDTVDLRSPDPEANPYLAFALLIYAALEGIKNKEELPAPLAIDLLNAPMTIRDQYETLPANLEEANHLARNSQFLKKYLPQGIIDQYCS